MCYCCCSLVFSVLRQQGPPRNKHNSTPTKGWRRKIRWNPYSYSVPSDDWRWCYLLSLFAVASHRIIIIENVRGVVKFSSHKKQNSFLKLNMHREQQRRDKIVDTVLFGKRTLTTMHVLIYSRNDAECHVIANVYAKCGRGSASWIRFMEFNCIPYFFWMKIENMYSHSHLGNWKPRQIQ